MITTGPSKWAGFFKVERVGGDTGFEVEENIESQNVVVSYGYYSSRDRKTGKSSHARFVFRWEFDGGEVARYEAVLDSAPIVPASRS